MIPQNHRLTRQEFIKVKKLGKNYSFPHFSLIVYPQPASKFSIVTSAKFNKSAVTRNAFRRKIYPLLLFQKPNAWIVLYPKSSMLKLTSDQIGSLLTSTLSPLLIS
jgi:ribonuclease P protein component